VKPLTGNRLCVDAAGLGKRRAEHGSAKSQASGELLPGEVSLPRIGKGEVSSGHSSW